MQIPDTEVRKLVRTELAKVRFDLQDLENRLRLLQECLVPFLPKRPEEEPVPEPPDLETHYHSVLGCWLKDHLSLLVREVGAFLAYPYPPVDPSPQFKPEDEPDDSGGPGSERL